MSYALAHSIFTSIPPVVPLPPSPLLNKPSIFSIKVKVVIGTRDPVVVNRASSLGFDWGMKLCPLFWKWSRRHTTTFTYVSGKLWDGWVLCWVSVKLMELYFYHNLNQLTIQCQKTQNVYASTLGCDKKQFKKCLSVCLFSPSWNSPFNL